MKWEEITKILKPYLDQGVLTEDDFIRVTPNFNENKTHFTFSIRYAMTELIKVSVGSRKSISDLLKIIKKSQLQEEVTQAIRTAEGMSKTLKKLQDVLSKGE